MVEYKRKRIIRDVEQEFVIIVKKKEENEIVDELLDRFIMEMFRFKQYVFNIEN